MGITKLLTGAVKAAAPKTGITSAVTKTIEKTTAKTTTTVITEAAGTVSETLPDIVKSINTNAKYYQYSPKTQQKVQDLRESIFKYAKEKNNIKLFTNHDSYITNLINYCSDEKTVYTIAGSMGNYNKYCNFAQKVFQEFKKAEYLKSEDLKSVLTNLTLMGFTDPKSFKTLVNSKGMKEIAAGNLSISYLKNLKSTDIIDENYFYKLFDNIEKVTDKRLVKSGLDKDIVNKYLKLYDKEICLNPNFTDDFITKLEKINNPELVNKLLNKFPMDAYFYKLGHKEVLKLIDKAAEHPDVIQKIIQLQNSTPYMSNHYTNLLISKKIPEIEELYSGYLKFEKAHPDICQPETLSCMVNFLENGGDRNILKGICNKAVELKDSDFIPNICINTNKDNIELLKSMLKNRTFNSENLFKFKMKARTPVSDTVLNEIYQKTYKPLIERLNKTNMAQYEKNYIAESLAEMRIKNPQEFKTLKDTKIIDLIQQGKIHPRILLNYGADNHFTPEIYSDIKKLLNGESLIKKFDTTKDILKNTTTGDVISVKGKLYINNNGRLEPWNMTEEKFNELFPLVDRFSTMQGKNDCFFISPLTAMYRNPKTRGEYYKMFEQKGNDICVTIPAYKDFLGEVRFPNGQIKVQDFNANAAPNVQMLEQAYARTALRKNEEHLVDTKNPLITDDLEYLQERINGGQLDNAMHELLPENVLIRKFADKTQIKQILNDFANDKRTIIQEGCVSPGRNTGHARTVTGYNPQTQTVTLIDPERTAHETTVPFEDFLKNVYHIILARPV